MLRFSGKDVLSAVYEWNEAVQKMLDYMEEHLEEDPSLLTISSQVGYSPTYCSCKFHEIVGMPLKRYMAGRRLYRAALDIRDTDARILDIALQYGYSSQEALTRAFSEAFGITPGAYRRMPIPLRLAPRQTVFFPEHYHNKGGPTMEKAILTEAHVRVEYIPAHRYIGIWDDSVSDYCSFWQHHSCDEVCGIIDSMSHVADPVITCHTAGWYRANGKRGYFYGLGVPEDYTGPIPENFTVRNIPSGYYLVFYHPAFDYLKDCAEVMERVENLAWNFDPASMGYRWDEETRPDYQRHFPEELGYEVLRPVTKL